MKLFANSVFRITAVPQFSFSVIGNQHLSKDAEVNTLLYRTLSSRNILSSTIPLMLWWLEPEELAFARLSVSSSRASRLPAFRNFSPPVRILLLLKEVSMRPLETCITTTGGGTLMILSREATGWVIRTPSTTCARKHPRPFSSSNLMVFLSPGLRRARSIREPSEDSRKSTARVTIY